MHGRIVLFTTLLVIGLQADIAQAQFSPEALIGRVARPFRSMLGRLGHFPYAVRRHPTRPAATGGAAGTSAATSGIHSQPQLATTGPFAWPTAYEDVIGYTFWPNDYAGKVRGQGFNIIAAPLSPSSKRPAIARASMTNVESDADDVTLPSACGGEQSAQITWPTAQIEQATQLNDAQRDALSKFQTALTDSVKTMLAGCRDITALSPTARLDATVQSIWAVRDAGIYVRTSLKAFYGSLTDEQKAKFEWKQPLQDEANPSTPADQNDKPQDSAMAKQYQTCAAPSLEASERLMKRIEQQVRPRKEQSAAIEALRKTSSETAKMLTATCAQPIPANPLARLDAANDQLSTMSYAATSIEMTLLGFYAQLDKGQQKKFDTLGQ